MILQIKLDLSADASPASKDSLVAQLTEVIAQALEEKQLEIPDAEITDYELTLDEREFNY